MATKDGQKSHRFKMTFPPKVLGDPLMHRLSQRADVVPNILRGRITGKSAWLEVELIGTDKGIDKALTFLKEQGVTISQLEG